MTKPTISPADFKATRRAAVKAVEELLGPDGEALPLKIEKCDAPDEPLSEIARTRDLIAGSRGQTRAQRFWSAIFNEAHARMRTSVGLSASRFASNL